MKKLKFLIFCLILVLVPSVFSFALSGRLAAFKGECQIRKTPDGEFIKAEKGMVFNQGDTIRTSTGSYAEINLSNRGVIRLMPETTLTFAFSSDTANALALSGGFALIKYAKAREGESITIETPSAKAEAKNALFKVYHTGDKTAFVCVSGSLFVSSNKDPWKYIEPVTLIKGKKIVLTSLINQTNAVITDATPSELFVDSAAASSDAGLVPEVLRLEDFRHEAEEAQRIEERRKRTGFKFNLALGGIQLQRQSYFSIALRPEFTYEDFSFALYLPLYLKGDTRPWNSSSWGNIGEWNFKSGHDTLGDLLLKIDYIKWGIKGTRYYVYFGRLEKFSFGNGFIVNNLSNLESYPMIKRTGFYAETNWDYFGFQMFITDINVTDVQGYRFFVRPFALKNILFQKLEIGIIGTFDANPRDDFRNNPSLFVMGIDIKVPVYKSKKLSLAVLADFVKQGYRFSYDSQKSSYSLPSSTSSSGLSFFKGFAADVALEAKLEKVLNAKAGYVVGYKGTPPEWMDVFYMIIRKQKADSIMSSSNEYTRHGFFLEARVNIKNIVFVKAKYMMMAGKSSGTALYDDKIHFSAGLVKGALWKLHLVIAYDRMDLSGSFFKNFFKKAILSIEAGVYWSDSVSFMAVYRRFFDLDLVEYRTFTLETRLEF